MQNRRWSMHLVLSLLPILGVTLRPSVSGFALPDSWSSICFLCGERALADGILNAILFLPFGLVLGRRKSIGVAALLGAVLSISVEAAQLFIIGRFSSVGDVLANSAGAALGAWVSQRERAAVLLASVLSLLALFAPAVLLAPAPPEGVYYGQWTAELGGLEPYRGRVLDARIARHRIPPQRIADSVPVWGSLRRGAPILVEFEVGAAPTGPAPILSIADDRQRISFMLGVAESDVFVSLWRRGSSLRLQTPRWWWRGALEGVAVGDTVRLLYALESDGPCLSVPGETRCLTTGTPIGGWSLLAPGGQGGLLYRMGGMLWAILLGVPLGLLAIPVRRRIFLSGTAALMVAVLSRSIPWWPIPWTGLLLLLLGTGLAISVERRRA